MAHATLLIPCTGRKLFWGLHERQYRCTTAQAAPLDIKVNKVMQINNKRWPSSWIMGKVGSGGNMRSPGTLLQAYGGSQISNRGGQMAIDLQWQNRLINWPPSRHVLTGCSQLLKLILSKKKIKRFFFFRRQSGENVLTWVQWRTRLSVTVVVVVGIGIYAIVNIVSLRGYLWKEAYWGESCVFVRASADVSVDLCVYSVFLSGWGMWSGRTD